MTVSGEQRYHFGTFDAVTGGGVHPIAYVDNADHVFDFVAKHRTIRIEDQFKALVDRGEIDFAAASEAGIGQRTIKRLSRLMDAKE